MFLPAGSLDVTVDRLPERGPRRAHTPHWAAILALTVLAAMATAASSPTPRREPTRSPLAAVGDFFSWERIPPTLEAGIAAFEEGRFFDVLALSGTALEGAAMRAYRGDALLLRSLALVGLGWDDLAAESLNGIVEIDPPSPYQPLALFELIEIHHRAGRDAAVAEVYGKHVEAVWRGGDARSRRSLDLLFAYGELRAGGTKHTRKEISRLSNPEELAVRVEKRGERASERLIYVAGLSLFKLRRHAESLRAFQRIGVESRYYPYALYGIAQNLHAVGREDEAIRTSRALLRYPVISPETRALRERGRLLLAEILLDSGDADRAVRVAALVSEESSSGAAARLFRTAILLEQGQPALAVTEWTHARKLSADPLLIASRGLGLGSAYSALGDHHSAAQELKQALDGLDGAELDSSALDEAALRLARGVREQVAARLLADRTRRARLARGIRRVVALEGPFGLGRLLRQIFLPDVPALALGSLSGSSFAAPPGSAVDQELWRAYVRSAEREEIERATALALRAEASSRKGVTSEVLNVLNAQLRWLEHFGPMAVAEESAPVAGEAHALAARLCADDAVGIPCLEIEPGDPKPETIASYRRRLAAGLRHTPKSLGSEAAPATASGADAARLLESSVEREIRGLLDRRNGSLRRLQFDLVTAQADALTHETEQARPGSSSPGNEATRDGNR